MLDDRANRQSWQVGEGADEHDRADEQNDEREPFGFECAQADGNVPFASEISRKREDRNDHEEAADQHRSGESEVPMSVAIRGRRGQAREGAAVAGDGRGVGVEQFTETVRTGVVQRGGAPRRGRAPGAETENRRGEDHQNHHHELHVVRFDFLAQVFRGFGRPSGRR